VARRESPVWDQTSAATLNPNPAVVESVGGAVMVVGAAEARGAAKSPAARARVEIQERMVTV
jgi:hypothetical protein